MKKNRLILTAAVAVSVMALAACGSSNKTPEATTAAAEATEASASDTATDSQLSADDPEIQALEATEVPELPKFSDMGTVKLCDLTGITVETSPKLTVDEDMVNSQIDYLRKNYLTETEDAAKEGDTVNIDFVGKMNGEAFDGGSGTGYDLVLGSGSFIDGFEDQLIGAKKGEKLEVNVTFPESYPNNPDLAGKPAVFDVTVNKVSTMPELTDQWVKEHAEDMGSKASDVASFRVEQQALLQAQVDYQYNNTIQQDALQQIVDTSEITVSDAMQKYAEDYVISQEVSTAKQYGHGLADMLNMYGMSVDDFKEEISSYATDYAKQRMVVAAIANEQGIKSSDQLIDELAVELSGLAGKELNKIQLIEQYGGDAVKDEAVNKAVLDYVQTQVKVVETTETSAAATEAVEETTAAESTAEAAEETTAAQG
ncbi:MAG: trigger factor [Oribacterium sp.]|nr:trigger factor [Oribacterium sp.]